LRGDNALARVKQGSYYDRICLRSADEKMHVCFGKSAGELDFFACAFRVFIRAVAGKRFEVGFGKPRKYLRVRA
jgi:hypothetical protein